MLSGAWFLSSSVHQHIWYCLFKILRTQGNGHHFACDIFKSILLQISLEFALIWSVRVVIASDHGSAPDRWQAIIWTNNGLIYWSIYACGHNELTKFTLNIPVPSSKISVINVLSIISCTPEQRITFQDFHEIVIVCCLPWMAVGPQLFCGNWNIISCATWWHHKFKCGNFTANMLIVTGPVSHTCVDEPLRPPLQRLKGF